MVFFFWGMTLCQWAVKFWPFKATWWPNLEGGNAMFPRNIKTKLPIDLALYRKKWNYLLFVYNCMQTYMGPTKK